LPASRPICLAASAIARSASDITLHHHSHLLPQSPHAGYRPFSLPTSSVLLPGRRRLVASARHDNSCPSTFPISPPASTKSRAPPTRERQPHMTLAHQPHTTLAHQPHARPPITSMHQPPMSPLADVPRRLPLCLHPIHRHLAVQHLRPVHQHPVVPIC
jgi:hypothetical protein